MKTVRVRIAVAVNKDGRWATYCFSGNSDATNIRNAFDNSPRGALISFIEADLPVPEAETIEGEVSQ